MKEDMIMQGRRCKRMLYLKKSKWMHIFMFGINDGKREFHCKAATDAGITC